MNSIDVDGGDGYRLVVDGVEIATMPPILRVYVRHENAEGDPAYLNREGALELYSFLEDWLLDTAQETENNDK